MTRLPGDPYGYGNESRIADQQGSHPAGCMTCFDDTSIFLGRIGFPHESVISVQTAPHFLVTEGEKDVKGV